MGRDDEPGARDHDAAVRWYRAGALMPAPRTSLVRDDYIIVRVRRLFRYDGRLVGPHSLFRGLLPVRRELALALVENGDVRLPARVPKSALQ